MRSPVEWHTCTVYEIEVAILHVKNTLASLDGILSLVIKKTWLVHQKKITNLFQTCLKISYHLFVFKNAILCILPKLKKRSCLLSQLYHLLALFSYLEKMLKRVIAKQLAC